MANIFEILYWELSKHSKEEFNNYIFNFFEFGDQPKEIINEHCNFNIDMGIFTK